MLGSERGSDASGRPMPARAHLWSALWSVAIVALLVLVAGAWSERRIMRSAIAMAHDHRPSRVRGLALNEEALRNDSLLPAFGSSELFVDVAYRADRFFEGVPPGHAMHVMAGGGVVLMNHVVEAGAFAPLLRDRPLIVFVAPVEIVMAQERREKFFAGNFSRGQAAQLFDGRGVRDSLVRDVGTLLMRYPSALAIDPVLASVTRLTRTQASTTERAMSVLMRPALLWDAAWLRAADLMRAATSPEVPNAAPSAGLTARSLGSERAAWESAIGDAHARWLSTSSTNPYGFPDEMWAKIVARDARGDHLQYGKLFAQQLANPMPWEELTLLLHMLLDAHARPLLVCLPMPGRYMDATGATPDVRSAFYQKLRNLTRIAGVPLIDFASQDLTPGLLADIENHLSPEGWLVVDRAIASFVTAAHS